MCLSCKNCRHFSKDGCFNPKRMSNGVPAQIPESCRCEFHGFGFGHNHDNPMPKKELAELHREMMEVQNLYD